MQNSVPGEPTHVCAGGLSARITINDANFLEFQNVAAGEVSTDHRNLIGVPTGAAVTVEAWCDDTGYAKAEGNLKNLTGGHYVYPVVAFPPTTEYECDVHLEESSEPVPCINTGSVLH